MTVAEKTHKGMARKLVDAFLIAALTVLTTLTVSNCVHIEILHYRAGGSVFDRQIAAFRIYPVTRERSLEVTERKYRTKHNLHEEAPLSERDKEYIKADADAHFERALRRNDLLKACGKKGLLQLLFCPVIIIINAILLLTKEAPSRWYSYLSLILNIICCAFMVYRGYPYCD